MHSVPDCNRQYCLIYAIASSAILIESRRALYLLLARSGFNTSLMKRNCFLPLRPTNQSGGDEASSASSPAKVANCSNPKCGSSWNIPENGLGAVLNVYWPSSVST